MFKKVELCDKIPDLWLKKEFSSKIMHFIMLIWNLNFLFLAKPSTVDVPSAVAPLPSDIYGAGSPTSKTRTDGSCPPWKNAEKLTDPLTSDTGLYFSYVLWINPFIHSFLFKGVSGMLFQFLFYLDQLNASLKASVWKTNIFFVF